MKIADLKARSEKDFQRILDKTHKTERPILRQHEETKISGIFEINEVTDKRGLVKTLLYRQERKRHAEIMKHEYNDLCKKNDVSKKRDGIIYLTWLYEVIHLDHEELKLSCDNMMKSIEYVLANQGNIAWALGCAEIEIFRFDVLRNNIAEGESVSRKLKVFEELCARDEISEQDANAIIHCHIVLFFDKDVECGIKEVKNAIRKYKAQVSHDLQLKRVKKDQSIENMMSYFARYHTKCGNENLKYKMKFRKTDPIHVESKMSSDGSFGRSDRKDFDEIVTEDSRALTFFEIDWLNKAYCWLMKRGEDEEMRGYRIFYER